MARAVNKGISLRAGLVLALAPGMMLGMVLGGCTLSAPNGGTGASRAGTGLDMVAQGRAVERDVEVPEVFSMEETGLWDGRPSLGGVWVAHPGADSPQRVLIRNAQSGESVIGALFRRERENPGPRFQISSEAANALGILPGAPSTISVVALRLEQIEMEPARATAQAETAAPSGIAAHPGTPAGQVDMITIDPGQEPPRQGCLAGLFGGGTDRQAQTTTQTQAIAQTALAPAEGTLAGVQQTAFAAAQEPQAQPEPREQRGLLGLFSRRQPEAAPVVAASPGAALIPLPDEPAAAAAPPPATASVSVISTLERPFVQIGIFSVESNATNARSQMQAAGLGAEIRRGRANDREFWRVVVGPASDAAARGQMLERVRTMGFTDAYAVVR